MGPTGVLQSLADAEVERLVAEFQALAPQSVAVAFLFAFRHPEHERRIAAALRGALGESVPVAASHEVLPVFREFERVSTTTAEAYLRPKVATYLAGLDRDARSRGVAALRIMTSAGGTLAPAAAACRTAALALSGPAGGVVGGRLGGAAGGLSELLIVDVGSPRADARLVAVGAAARECGARPRPPAHGAGAVRRCRTAVRLRARRRARHTPHRHPTAPGSTVRPRPRCGRGTRGPAHVLSPRARSAPAGRFGECLQPPAARGEQAAARGRALAI